MRLELGKPVRCSDGVFGELADVVVDPIQKRVTHLVVRPHGLDGVSRLVPVELADSGDDTTPEVELRCTIAEVGELDYVQEYAYLRLGEVPTGDPEWDVGVESVLGMPYYSSDLLGDDVGGFDASSGMVYDRVPKGEVEIRRTSVVTASDGGVLGQVDGFVVDGDGQITHFVLERGHLWGRRDVTIPIGAVAKVETDTVTLTLSEKEVGALPSVRVHRWL
jgi:sporulation protein YlmC with PRC-barrel domain